MRGPRVDFGRHRCFFFLLITLAFTFSAYIEEVVGLPIDSESQWPTFPRRNVAALARDGYLRNSGSKSSYKRGISTLAKNGLLPTYRSPYLDTEKQDQNQEESQEKRNLASIARLRSYTAMKRNIQALARDGYRFGRSQNNPENDKRNIAALARNGLIHKKDEVNGDEFYYPFYQNPVPPLSELDRPLDFNEIYNLQQSINPDMFPPLSQVFKRSLFTPYNEYIDQNDLEDTVNSKRSFAGSPVHGLYRPMYVEPSARTKRYILQLPDFMDANDIDKPDETDNDDKRSVGSIPLTRISELGNISLVPRLTQQIQTTPTYRRRQYLLTRTRPAGSSTDR